MFGRRAATPDLRARVARPEVRALKGAAMIRASRGDARDAARECGDGLVRSRHGSYSNYSGSNFPKEARIRLLFRIVGRLTVLESVVEMGLLGDTRSGRFGHRRNDAGEAGVHGAEQWVKPQGRSQYPAGWEGVSGIDSVCRVFGRRATTPDLRARVGWAGVRALKGAATSEGWRLL